MRMSLGRERSGSAMLEGLQVKGRGRGLRALRVPTSQLSAFTVAQVHGLIRSGGEVASKWPFITPSPQPCRPAGMHIRVRNEALPEAQVLYSPWYCAGGDREGKRAPEQHGLLPSQQEVRRKESQ